MNQLCVNEVEMVSGGIVPILVGVAVWILANDDKVTRFFDSAFEAYGRNQAEHK